MPRISLHTRFCHFVSWIRPDPAKTDDVRRQRDEVRDRIQRKAEDDGLIVRSTPNSGSFATATGLRRHRLGGADHDGQDIDNPFVLSGEDEDGNPLEELLDRFEGYAEASYPDTKRVRTKSSIRLEFAASKRNFDLVPMLAVDNKDDEQILLREGGERRQTSIQQHVAFVKKRTKASQEVEGSVAFNDSVRLMKWWRECRVSDSKLIDEVPSFMMLLLCASVFDEKSVRKTWPDTMHLWFDRIHSVAANRRDITFRDYDTPRPEKVSGVWKIIDPVNGHNNAVPTSWTGIKTDEFRDWAASARDKMQLAIAFDMKQRDGEAVALMSDVFGTAFANHSEG